MLIVVAFRVDPAHGGEFARAIRPVRFSRLRDGDLQWGLFRDITDPGCDIETFIVESWGEHLRQHERMTVADRRAEERARSFHVGREPPIVSHYVADLMDE